MKNETESTITRIIYYHVNEDGRKMNLYYIRAIALFSNVVFLVHTYRTAVQLESRMDGRDMVIRCRMPKFIYSGSYRLDWMFRRTQGIITTCRPNKKTPCLEPSVKSTEWTDTHKFEVISGGASLRIIQFKNTAEDEEFTCGIYDGSDFSRQISFSVKSLYKTLLAGDGGKSTISMPYSIFTTQDTVAKSQDTVTETNQYTDKIVDNISHNSNIATSVLAVFFAISACINIGVVILLSWLYKYRNTGSYIHRLLDKRFMIYKEELEEVEVQGEERTSGDGMDQIDADNLSKHGTDRRADDFKRDDNQSTRETNLRDSVDPSTKASTATDPEEEPPKSPSASTTTKTEEKPTVLPLSVTQNPCLHSPLPWKQATPNKTITSVPWNSAVTSKSQEKTPVPSKPAKSYGKPSVPSKSASSGPNDNRATKYHVKRKKEMFEKKAKDNGGCQQNDAVKSVAAQIYYKINISEDEKIHSRKMIVDKKPFGEDEGNQQNNGNPDTHQTESDKQPKNIENEKTKDEFKSSTKMESYAEASTDFNVYEERNTENTKNDSGKDDNLSSGRNEGEEQRQYEVNLLKTSEKEEELMDEDENNPATPLIYH